MSMAKSAGDVRGQVKERMVGVSICHDFALTPFKHSINLLNVVFHQGMTAINSTTGNIWSGTMNGDLILRAVLIGVGATAAMDLWALFLRRMFGIPSLDYAWVGRWLLHFRHGRFAHENIAKAAPISGEAILGWCAHYAIGIAFAALMLALGGAGWAQHPTPLLALTVGLVTVVFPFFIMQPAFGFGIAASRTPKPAISRQRSLIAHFSFGVGLYLSALLLASISA
ncbi:DUF2938 domain-containing protein [Mesorhizobium sp. NPDC059025]|uniref:DUF2938 domain-containing protein n=1 Tax=unclassified Mesorhizobium TaxID=325217 RepID=UPI0036ACC69A